MALHLEPMLVVLHQDGSLIRFGFNPDRFDLHNVLKIDIAKTSERLIVVRILNLLGLRVIHTGVPRQILLLNDNKDIYSLRGVDV